VEWLDSIFYHHSGKVERVFQLVVEKWLNSICNMLEPMVVIFVSVIYSLKRSESQMWNLRYRTKRTGSGADFCFPPCWGSTFRVTLFVLCALCPWKGSFHSIGKSMHLNLACQLNSSLFLFSVSELMGHFLFWVWNPKTDNKFAKFWGSTQSPLCTYTEL
jgi:hypothetical protein